MLRSHPHAWRYVLASAAVPAAIILAMRQADFLAIVGSLRREPGVSPAQHRRRADFMIEQTVQVVGALLVLAGFLAAQADLLDQRTYTYLIPNAVGSAAMAATAVLTSEWGFVFLEGVWALVSLRGLVGRLRGTPGLVPPADADAGS